jgi:hypothetical protein
MSLDQPLFVMASVYYPLRKTFKGYQWISFSHIKEFAISSTMVPRLPVDLKQAGVKATDAVETTLDDFSREWQDWYRLEWANPNVWHAATRKVKDPKWRGPDGSALAVDVLSPADVTLVVNVRQNDWGAFPQQPSGEYAASQALKGSPDWQTVTFRLEDFLPCNDRTQGPLSNWRTLTELALCGTAEVVKDGAKVRLGDRRWPEPRRFRNLRWVGGQRAAEAGATGAGTLTPQQLEGQIQKAIKESTDQEKRERKRK